MLKHVFLPAIGVLVLALNGCAKSPEVQSHSSTPPPPPPASAPQSIDKPGWTLVFHDEFEKPDLDLYKWIPRYRGMEVLPANYLIENGILHLRMDKDRPPMRGPNDRVCGIETRRSRRPFAQQYGLFELRAKCAKGSGMQSAWWMSPMDRDYETLNTEGGIRKSPTECSEIDIFEQLGREPKWNNFTVHYGSAAKPGSDPTHAELPFDMTSDFHVYLFEWNEKEMIWWVDGIEVKRSDKVPHHAFFIRLSLYEGDNNWRGKVDRTQPYPKDFDIDYVRVYSKTS